MRSHAILILPKTSSPTTIHPGHCTATVRRACTGPTEARLLRNDPARPKDVKGEERHANPVNVQNSSSVQRMCCKESPVDRVRNCEDKGS
ncbi:unnamed protein product [Calypogeia fissa]